MMIAASTRKATARSLVASQTRGVGRLLSTAVPSWATCEPKGLGIDGTYHIPNCVDGEWKFAAKSIEIPHPLNKDAPYPIFTIPDTQVDELQPFLDSLRKVSKSGVHNPLKNPHRYLEYGEISRKVRQALFMMVQLESPVFLFCFTT